MTTTANFRAVCRRCGDRFAWQGTLFDMPPCPRCGQTMPAAEKRQAQLQMELAGQNNAIARIRIAQ